MEFVDSRAGYDEFYECSFQEEYIGEETWQTYTCPFWISFPYVPDWSYRQVG